MKVLLANCLLWLAAVAILLAAAAVCAILEAAFFARPAHAETVMACVKVALPGPGNTLNPHDPPARRRQDIIKLCAPYPVEDKRPRGPVLDYRHDVRVFA